MNIIRKLKISEIVSIEFTETEQEIIDLFNNILSDLVVFIDESEPDMINYMKVDGIFIMQQDNKNDRLWVRYQGFWIILQFDFGLKYIEIQTLISGMVERAFKEKLSTPNGMFDLSHMAVERTFKEKLSTPTPEDYLKTFPVEIAFKQKLSTPITLDSTAILKVERAFIKKVSTHNSWCSRSFLVVERAIKQSINSIKCLFKQDRKSF